MAIYGKREEIAVEVERASLDDLPFYAVSSAKLALLSVATLGLYELYWFYRNWRCVKERTGRDISPFWRGVFSPIFCYGMASAVRSAAESVHVQPRFQPATIALAYVAILALEALPDPWWLASMLTFVPLLPVAAEIRTVHERLRPGLDGTVGWSARSVAALVVGGAFVSLAALGTFGPPTHVQLGAEVPERRARVLREAGILEPGERIEFLYSSAFFSVASEGNLLTDRRVVSWEEAAGERYVYAAPFAEVAAVEPEYSSGAFTDSVLTVHTRDGDSFLLFLSNEKGRDRAFVEALVERIAPGAGP